MGGSQKEKRRRFKVIILITSKKKEKTNLKLNSFANGYEGRSLFGPLF